MSRLIYLADPMCSWCYGFGPQLSTLLAQKDTEVRLVMGGLRAYNTRVMDAALKSSLREHWQHVHEASGLPFSEALLARDDFIYDTESACRAVVTIRAQAPERVLNYFHAVQSTFYAEGRDVTQAEVLTDCVAKLGLAQEAFVAAYHSAAMKEETRRDFLFTQRLGVTGFPTLLLEHGGVFHLVTAGFMRTNDVAARIATILANVEQTT